MLPPWERIEYRCAETERHIRSRSGWHAGVNMPFHKLSTSNRLRIRRSMRRLIGPVPLLFMIPLIALMFAARSSVPAEGLRLTASLSEKTLTVRRGDETVRVYPIAVGTGKHPTPAGSYAIRRMVWNPRWVPPDQPWARGRWRRGQVIPDNPMRTVKMFFGNRPSTSTERTRWDRWDGRRRTAVCGWTRRCGGARPDGDGEWGSVARLGLG
jgi:hypothetical protein